MNSSYIEQMNILVDDFNSELSKKFEGKDISELGIIDLRKLKMDYTSLNELNLDLQDSVEHDSSISEEERKNILNIGDELYENNRQALVALQEVLTSKVSLAMQKTKERRELINRKDANKRVLDNLKISRKEFKEKSLFITDENTRQVYQSVIDSFDKNIESLEALDKSFEDRIKALENEIDILRHGGIVEEVKRVIEETTPLTEEEAEKLEHESDKRIEEAVQEEAKKPEEPKPEEKKEEVKEEITPVEAPKKPEEIHPIEPEPIAPPAGEPVIEEPKPEVPKVPPMSLQGLIASGQIPSILKEEELVKICKDLGIPASDMSFEVNQEQLSRLKNDKYIEIATVNQGIVGRHQEKIDEYDKLISQYEDMLSGKLSGKAFSPEYRDKVSSIVDRLKSERANYQAKIDTITSQSVFEHFDFNKSPINSAQKVNMERIDERHEKINDKLRSQYEKLDRQREKKSILLSDRMKKRQDRRIVKTLEKIKVLQEKKGKVSSTQTRIINENSGKYIETVTKKQQRQIAAQKVIAQNAEQMIQMQERIDSLHKDSENLSHDIGTLDKSKLSDRIAKFGAQRELHSLERKIESLKRKQGRCDRRVQHMQGVSEHMSR